ncbi:MAG TPA: DUF4389 domain-containing protein [Pseudonocardia sp.]|jgi:hypothetical protein
MTGDVSPGAALEIDPPAAQRRWTVLLRMILIIPQWFVLLFVGIAAAAVVFIGWWAALFTGRLPDWAAEFLTGYLSWSARLYAYGTLLVDRYPPFSFSAEGYPVRVVLPPPTELNRLAVLFRLILLIPAALVLEFVGYGWALLSFFIWLVVLILGRPPEALFGATAAMIRYQLRYVAYGMMLTSVYPKRLFGDETVDAMPPTSPTNPLRLTRNARVLLIVMLVVGVLGFVGQITLNVTSANRFGSSGYGTSGYGTF